MFTICQAQLDEGEDIEGDLGRGGGLSNDSSDLPPSPNVGLTHSCNRHTHKRTSLQQRQDPLLATLQCIEKH